MLLFYWLQDVPSVGELMNLDAVFLMQSYPARVLDRRLLEDWARAAKEGLGVLMNPRVDF